MKEIGVKEFIKDTLKQISEGIEESQQILNDKMKINAYDSDKLTTITFDIAVTVLKELDKKGGGGLKIAIANLEGGISNKKETSSISRVKFKFPVVLPNPQYVKKNDKPK